MGRTNIEVADDLEAAMALIGARSKREIASTRIWL